MVENETVVTVIDLVAPVDGDPGPSQRRASTELGIVDGGLLVAVGLATLAVEGVARAVVVALGDHSPLLGGTADVDENENGTAGPGAADTVAVVAGAGLHLALGTARFVTRMAAGLDRAIRPLPLVSMIPSVDRGARRLEESAHRLNAAWRDERLESQRAAEAFADALLPHVIDAVIDRLDLTELVLERVDLDRVAESIAIDRLIERVDLDGVIARVDVALIIGRVDPMTIIDRVDLVTIARNVVDELDLPEIIRGSTETMAAETRDSVRVQGMRADRLVSRLVDRALPRRNGESAHSPSDEGGSTEDPP